MILDEQVIKYSALDNWFKTPQGVRAAQAFASELKEPSELFSGKRLLQLGSCGDNPWLSALNFRHKWFVTPCETSHKSALVSSLSSLPIDRNSIDCVVAPLTLEAFGHDKNPIDEIDLLSLEYKQHQDFVFASSCKILFFQRSGYHLRLK